MHRVPSLMVIATILSVPLVGVVLPGCGGGAGPTLTGQVVDVWGTPIAGATVLVEGGTTRPLTDADGLFSLPAVVGTLKLKAGKDGYIQDHLDVEVSDLNNPPRPMVKLYPKPSENGFYVVGTHEYQRIQAEPVHWLGNDIANVQGLKSVGEAVASPDMEIVFHTDLQEDEIARLGLELRAMSFLPSKVLPGPLGDESVTLNLYVAGPPVKYDLEPLRSKTDFLISARGLTEGAYAFHMNRLLDAKDYDSFARNPEALRVVFPLRVE